MNTTTSLAAWLHLVTVHFPVALWLLLAGLAWHPRWRTRTETLRLVAILALLTTVVAVVSGLVYLDGAAFQGAGAELIGRHRLAGLVTVALGAAATVTVVLAGRREAELPIAGRALALLAALAVGLTAHWGGESVHGDEIFGLGGGAEAPAAAPETPAAAPEAPAAPTAAAPDFDGEVWPILKKSCVRCHGHKKQKGELRLDSLAAAQAGGESGKPALVPGDAAKSEMIARITLPDDHEDYMPSKGDPLTADQVDVLKRWVAGGAPWPAAMAPGGSP